MFSELCHLGKPAAWVFCFFEQWSFTGQVSEDIIAYRARYERG